MATPALLSARGQPSDDEHDGRDRYHDNHAYVINDDHVTTKGDHDVARKAPSHRPLQLPVMPDVDVTRHSVSITERAVPADRDYRYENEANEVRIVENEAGRDTARQGEGSEETRAHGDGKSGGNTGNGTGGHQRLEDLIEELGGFGLFQVLLLCMVFGVKMSFAYSVLIMAFAAAVPDWWCQTSSNATSSQHGNGSEDAAMKQCTVNGTQCQDFRFSASAFHGVVSEWNLVCDRQWLSSTITSVQMAGLLVGAVGAGQLADVWGRKNTMFLMILIQTVFSLGAGFSNSLELFTACRFFAGLAAGGFIVVYFPLPLEFLSARWRSIMGAIPTWSFGVGVLSLVAWLSHDWRWLNWIEAALSGVFLLFYPFIPESVRWLVLKNKMEEAEKVIRKVAKMNGRPMPDLKMVHEIARLEAERAKERGRKYCYLDLFRNRRLVVCTVWFNVLWFICGLVYYMLSFGVDVLSGSLYLNVFLMSVVEIPSTTLTAVLNNSRLGRRWTSFLFFLIACVTAAAAVITYYVLDDDGTAVRVEVLLCKVGLAAAWPCVQVFSNESFPTVVRSIGYGACNLSGRVGGVVAPYLALLGAHYFGMLYTVVAALMAVCAFVCLLFRETRGRALDDTMDDFLAGQEARDAQKQH